MLERLREWGSHHPFLVLAVFGVLFRLALLPFVKVSADTSLYTYDAMLALGGQTPIADYPTRSPFFSYIYAAPLALGLGKMLTARLTMLAAAVVLGGGIYRLTRTLHSERAAMAATFLYFATPLSVVYGQLLYTEQVTQLFVIGAILLLYGHLDDETVPYRYPLAIGALFGIAFLVRRVVLVQVGVIGLFLLYYWTVREEQPLSKPVSYGIALAIGMGATMAAGYLWLGWPSVDDALLIAEQHVVWLFRGSPVGHVGWVEMTTIPAGADTTGPFGSFPGPRKLFIKLTHLFAVSMPVAIPLIAVGRSYLADRSLPESTDTALGVGLVAAFVLGGIGRWLLLPIGTVRPAVVGLVGAVAVAALWRHAPIPFRDLWDPRFALFVGFMVLVTAGYFALGSLGFVHFLDVLPYVSVVTGVLAVELLDHRTSGDARRVPVAAAVLVLAVAAGLLSATALVADPGVGGGTGESLDTVAEVEAVNDDVGSRLDAGESVLVAQPMYVFESGTRQTGDLSRGYWIMRHAPDSAPARRLEARLLSRIDDGSVQYVIVDKWTRILLERSAALDSAVEENFCPVADDEVYEATGADLYVRSEAAPDCDGSAAALSAADPLHRPTIDRRHEP
jgi:hypothetical protein